MEMSPEDAVMTDTCRKTALTPTHCYMSQTAEEETAPLLCLSTHIDTEIDIHRYRHGIIFSWGRAKVHEAGYRLHTRPVKTCVYVCLPLRNFKP